MGLEFVFECSFHQWDVHDWTINKTNFHEFFTTEVTTFLRFTHWIFFSIFLRSLQKEYIKIPRVIFTLFQKITGELRNCWQKLLTATFICLFSNGKPRESFFKNIFDFPFCLFFFVFNQNFLPAFLFRVQHFILMLFFICYRRLGFCSHLQDGMEKCLKNSAFFAEKQN